MENLIALLLKESGYAAILALTIIMIFRVIEQYIGRRNDNVTESIRFDNAITSVLSELVQHYNANSAFLWQFHNGIQSVAEVPFYYVDITHECRSLRKHSRGVLGQKFLTSHINDFLYHTVINHNHVYDVSDEDGFEPLAELGITRLITVPVYIGTRLVGLVSIISDKVDDDMGKMHEAAGRIAELIRLYKKGV